MRCAAEASSTRRAARGPGVGLLLSPALGPLSLSFCFVHAEQSRELGDVGGAAPRLIVGGSTRARRVAASASTERSELLRKRLWSSKT